MADLTHAKGLILQAEHLDHPAERYLAAYRSAEQVALALVSVAPRGRSRQPLWSLLTRVAPEFGEWADFFGAMGPRALAVEAGATALVSERDADDLARDAQQFLVLATTWLRRHARAVGTEVS